tara:strand:- start:466 stop:750 length:285 start_codon:yes stop_codon:yes gene_type:complete
MFWTIYIFITIFFSYLVHLFLKRNLVTFILFVMLITPAQVEISSNNYAPAIFTFFFNFVLERNYSLRVLRPLILSIPASLIALWSIKIIKKRFF